MHFHNILLQIQYSVTKPIEILHTIADSLQYFYFIITAFNKTIRNSFANYICDFSFPITKSRNAMPEFRK